MILGAKVLQTVEALTAERLTHNKTRPQTLKEMTINQGNDHKASKLRHANMWKTCKDKLNENKTSKMR